MKKMMITLAGLMLAGAAHAGIATMENLDTDGDFLAVAELAPYGGLNWSDSWYAGDTGIDGYDNGARSGTHFLVNGFGADNMDIASDSGFNFAGAWFATANGAAEKASWVNIKAYDVAGKLIGSSGNVAIGASYTWVGANFGQVARLDITRDAGWYVMDDFATTSPVPEPQAPLMLLAGLLTLACVKRKSSFGRL